MARYRSSNGQRRPYKDGKRWVVRLEEQLPDGRIITASGSSARNREECLDRAQANLAKKVQEARQEKLAHTPASSVSTWLEYWMANKTNLKPKTKVSYQASIDKRILPAIGSKALDAVTLDDIEGIHSQILSEGCSRTIWATTKTVLKQAFDDAVKRGHIDRSPALHAPGLQPKKRSENWLTPEQAWRVIHKSPDFAEKARWSLAMLLGIRQGEALALLWTDLNLDDSDPQMVVGASLGWVTGKGLVYGETKTRQRRVLPLPAELVEILKHHRREQRERFLAMGLGWSKETPVFAVVRKNGKAAGPLDPANDRKRWLKALERAEVPRFRLHDARHAAAATMMSASVEMYVISKALGHASIATTVDTYGHLATGPLRSAFEASSSVLAQAGQAPA